MIPEDRIAALRALIHDLNGALSVVTMEAFAIDRLAGSESLKDAARNLRHAADSAARTVVRIEAFTDDLNKRADE